MIKLIIFDLDGTLLNTLEDLVVSTNHALAQNGFPQHELSEYRYFVGNGITKLTERALPEDQRSEETIMKVRQDFVNYYSEHNMDRTKPYPGIPELIEQLKAQKISMAVASNKYQAATAKLIAHYFADGTFATVYGQRDNVPAKPDPTVVYNILGETGYTREETLYIGDSSVDMRTAANSGLRSVAVTWGFRPRQELEENGAVYIIDHPEQLLEIIETLNR